MQAKGGASRYNRLNIHDLPATKTSIVFGVGHQNPFQTTNSWVFGKNRGPASTVNKDFISNIKANHFEYGDHKMLQNKSAIQAQYQSLTKASFNFDGDAKSVQAKLDQAKKADLRQNHFKIGGPTANFKATTNNKAYRPLTAQQRSNAKPELNREQLNDLRASHWTYGLKTQAQKLRPASANFITSNMLAYKWV
jgi:hypothetical protein